MGGKPPAANESVSRRMARQKVRDTRPEIMLRQELHGRGLRYRLHTRDLPGTPDIAFGPARVAVFVDGCFWHGCPEHLVTPRSNRDWWIEKLEATSRRDRTKDENLVRMGWLPIHVWEHEDPASAADGIERTVIARRND